MTVYAYGNVDALHGIFNAVAMVMSSDDFGDMIRVAVIIGFLVVAVLMVNPKNIAKGWNWFICVAVLTGVVLTPKATVTIEDRLGMQAPAVVANVPWALAVIAQVKTAIGATLTDLSETAFQTIPEEGRALPTELSYLEHGVMFGNRLVRASREADFHSLNTQGDTLNYLRNCIFPSLGREAVPGAFETSSSLIDEISHPNPALFSTYHDTANGGELVSAPCDQVFSRIQPTLVIAGQAALRSMATRLMPNVDGAMAEAKVTDSLLAMYGKARLAEAGATAQDIMIQNILINATADSSALYSASLDDPAVMMFASLRSQAVGSMNAGYLVQGRIAEEALPIVRNITDAILYAVFPVLCILAIASEGRALAALAKGYLLVMVWVELWPPMFAVVNYLQTLAASGNLAAAATLPMGGGLSLQTATGIYSTAVSDVAVAAWMVTFVPVLAGAVLFGMDRIMSIAGARPGASQAESEAPQASKGNVNMGNVTMDQQQISAYRSSPTMTTFAGVGGMSTVDALTGGARYQHAQSSGPVSVSDVSSLAREQAQGATQSLQFAQSDARSAETLIQSAIGRVDGLAKSGAFGAEGGQAWNKAREATEADNSQDVRTVGEQLIRQFGTNDSAGLTKALQAGVDVGGVMKFLGRWADPDQATGKQGVGLSAGGQFSGNLGSSAQRAVTEAVSGLRNRSAQRTASAVEKFANSTQFRSSESSDTRALEDVRADLQRASSFRESSASRLDEAHQFQETERKLNALQHSWTISNANAFYEFAAREGKHPGNANISRKQWVDTLQRFLNVGEIGRDDDGNFFMPQVGQGPNIMQTIKPDLLRVGYQSSTPRGGQEMVVQDAAARRGEVQGAQRRAGVSPHGEVDGTGLKSDVATGQGQVELRIEQSNESAKTHLAAQQMGSDAAFKNAPAQAGSFLHSIASDSEGNGTGVEATRVQVSRPRPGRQDLDDWNEKRKASNSEIPTK
ncbi:conjugal transfer protein TraG N-terminal domain-containing protein [Ideonella sp. YS5]